VSTLPAWRASWTRSRNSIARSGRSQYRLLFAVGTNNDSVKHFAFFTRTAFVLTLTYVIQ